MLVSYFIDPIYSNALIFHFISEGDCKSFIHLWEPASDATWNVDPKPFTGHAASVEDLQVHILSVKQYLNFLDFRQMNLKIMIHHEWFTINCSIL